MTASLRVLIACEFTGTVRREFEALGHDAWSCDLRRSLDGSNRHIVGDAREVVQWGWDLLIVAHPPCTRLCNSGVRWINDPSKMTNLGEDFTDAERLTWPSMDLEAKRALMLVKLDEGAKLFSDLWNCGIERIAVENPVMHKHAKALISNYEEFAQSVQPWQYGDWERKRTCLWLRGLEPLKPLYPTLDAARLALGSGATIAPLSSFGKLFTNRTNRLTNLAQRNIKRARRRGLQPGSRDITAHFAGKLLADITGHFARMQGLPD